MKEENINTQTVSATRTRYTKPEGVKQLEKDYFQWKYKDSSIPENCRFVTKLRDDSANRLTDCIEKYCKVHGYHFQRMNSFGLYDARLKKWRPSGTTKGISDALMIKDGKTIHVEIKYGRDRQSDRQKEIQRSIEAAGGTYIIVRTYEDFLQQISRL